MKTLTTLIIAFIVAVTLHAQTIHVTTTGSGDGSGANWANASTLEHAVSVATSGTAIWVEAGTYNLSATLVVPQGVRLYGGFAGAETYVEQRNFAENRTVFDANTHFAAVTLESLAVLSGVTVQNGVANIPTRMNGGGVLMRAGSRIESSYIINNVAANRGGGIFAEENAEIYNSVIAHNRAGISGFAVSGDEVIFRSNTVAENTMLDCRNYANETFQTTVCAGESLVLIANTLGTYLWSTGATTPTITTPVLTESTTFTVTVTTPTFCVITDTFQITVNPVPTVTISVVPPQANPGATVTFIATGTPPGGNFLWDDDALTTSDTLRAQMPNAGDLQFTVHYELDGCEAEPVMATATNTNFFPPIIDDAILIADDETICLGDSTLLRLIDAERNSGEWVLYSDSCGGTEIARSLANNPTFWVSPTTQTTFFIRGEGGGTETECLSITITVNPLPLPITAPSTTVCAGENLVLSNLTEGGGTWRVETGELTIVSQTPNSATVTGTTPGDATVVFAATNGCRAFFDLEVLAIPTQIIGDTNLCQGASQMFTSTPIGGTWAIASGTSATIHPTTGLVTASPTLTGPTVIQYTHPTTGCAVSQEIVVHPQPTKPSAVANEVCVGDTLNLNPGTPAGGTWSIAPAHLAEFNTEFTQIIGLVAGHAVVRYQLNAHCFDTFHIAVLSPVTSLSYANELCEGGISTASGMPTGGTWASTATAIATVDSETGLFTGISAGEFSLIYTLENGCSRTSTPITVHPTPEPITGESAVGVGLTTQLTSSPSGGTWSSLNPAVATVDANGLVTGVGAGTTVIRYTLPMGSCSRDFLMTVEMCAALTWLHPERLAQHLCLNEPILYIQFGLYNATTSHIQWTPSVPTGITFDSETHTISGVPAVSGVFTYTITSVEHSLACPPASVSGTLTVFDEVSPGEIGSAAGTSISICYGEVPVEFTSAASGSGGYSVHSYQWQVSTDGVTFNDIEGATSLAYQSLALTETHHFRRVFNNICATDLAVSNVITVTVHSLPPTPAAESITPNTDCSGDNPNGIIVIAEIAGMTYSIDGINFGANRTFENLTHGQHAIFIRNANGCVSSANVTVGSESGAPVLVGTMDVTPGETICNPFPGGNIVISPTFTNLGTNPTFQWSIVGGANIPGAVSQNLTLTTAPTETTTYRITATNMQTGCHVHFDQTITVITPPIITNQPVGDTICVGQPAVVLSVVASCDDVHTYKWQSSPDNVNFTDIPSATATFLTIPNTAASSLWYRVQILRVGDVCPTVSSDAVHVKILDQPTITFVANGQRCEAGVVQLSAIANPTTADIRWFANPTGGTELGTSASGATWETPSIAASTTFWAEAHNGFCVSERVAVEAVVYPPHVITRTGGSANQAVCKGASIIPINFDFSGGATGGVITWSGASTTAPLGITATGTSISGTIAENATPGTYYFIVRSTPAIGMCAQATYFGSIVVYPTPTAVVVSSTPECGSTVLTASGGVGGTIYWQGTTSMGTSTATPDTSQTVSANGTYFFRARSAEGCWGTQGSYTVTIVLPHTLELTSAPTTANQRIGINQSIVDIVYTRGGSATAVVITWTGTTDPHTPPPGITVSPLTENPITISGGPTLHGIFGFSIATVGTDICPASNTLTGTIELTNFCNTNTPGWGTDLGTITWGSSSNTDIEMGTTVIRGTDGRPDQLWSGPVFTTACAKGNTQNGNEFSGGTVGNYNADCRQSLPSVSNRATSISGDFFSWCAVHRFGYQLCPYPWRVPSTEDFGILHQNLGYQLPAAGSNNVPIIANTYIPIAGTAASPQIGGIWRGIRFTGNTGSLTNVTANYWSSTEAGPVTGRSLGAGVTLAFPQNSSNKHFGFSVRCVRDTVLPPLPLGCNGVTPGWGSSLGTIMWGESTDIESEQTKIPGTGGRATQIWSAAVSASACNKTTYSGGSQGSFNADCRRASNGFHGHYFSWCAVIRFEDVLCPYPWRVPTRQDFVDLDLNLGGNGMNRSGANGAIDGIPITTQVAWYIGSEGTGQTAVNNGGIWRGSRFTAWASVPTNMWSFYWSSSNQTETLAALLTIGSNNIDPRVSTTKSSGLPVRCVR